MATPADTLRQYMVTLGIAVTPSSGNPWPIVSGPMPATLTSPDKYISVNNTGAINRGRDQRTGSRAEQPTCQFMVRAEDEDDVYDKCQEITAALDRVGTAPPTGVGWVTVTTEGDSHLLRAAHVTTPPSYIGLEETSRRVLYSINVRLSWEQL